MANEIVVQDKRHSALEQSPVLTPMQELQMQIVRTGDIEKLKELRAIEKEWRADQARAAFVEAMAAFKSETIRIIRDKKNMQYGSMYVTLGNLVQTVTPFLSRHGLSVTWEQDESNAPNVRVTCTVRHQFGHSESVSFACSPDDSGKKNPIQQRKSAITYARAITYEMALGLAASNDANLEDDGNSAGGTEEGFIEEGVAADFLSNIEGSGDVEELQRNYNAALDAAMDAKDKRALSNFSTAKNNRLLQLKKGAAHAGK